jgi:hypothetical protein
MSGIPELPSTEVERCPNCGHRLRVRNKAILRAIDILQRWVHDGSPGPLGDSLEDLNEPPPNNNRDTLTFALMNTRYWPEPTTHPCLSLAIIDG